MRGLPNKLKQHISDISHLDLIICIRINVFQLTKRRCSKEFITNYETGLAYLIMTSGFSTVTGSVTLRLLPSSLTPFTSPRFEEDALLHSIICERLLRLKFPNFWEQAQGWYYREQGFRRGENIRPPTTCNFSYCVSFIPHKWKYSPHAFAQCKRTVIKYAYDRTDVPEKWTNAISSAMSCILRTFARGSL